MSRKRRILYAEDEEVLGKLVCEQLEKRSYVVHWAKNGQEALSALKSSTFDLCLLDVMMPVMDGFTLAETIRDVQPQIPIIFLTAKIESEAVVQGFEVGGNDYLRKPFSMEELHARIKNQLNRSQIEPNAEEIESVIGKYRYYHEIQELEFESKRYKLSHREHELLVMLLRANKQVVERRSILKKIWGDDSFFNSRNLDVYIRKLRKRFEHDDLVEIITLKGRGYRFVY